MIAVKINWKVRFKNKTWLLSFSALVLSFIYNILGMFEVVPPVSQELTNNLILAVVQILTTVGVLVDPTTAGVKDSEQAMTYEEPKKD